jgi:galactokinase
VSAAAHAAAAQAAASAPGRVNLIGEHLDYNGGPVLPVALERRTSVAAAPADAGIWEMTSSLDGRADGRAARVAVERMTGAWTDYVSGVVLELEALGAAPAGARIAVTSTLPAGAGLGSSAALTVAAALALSRLAGRRLDAARLADVAWRAEHDRVGVRCGRMDQTIAAHARAGHALLFETATGERRHLPLPGALWIVETGVSHRLAGGALNERRDECERALGLLRPGRPGLARLAELAPADLAEAESVLAAEPALLRRVRHVVTETARVRAAAAALAAGDLAAVGALLVEGHRSLRDDYESTVPEADLIVDAAVRHGAWGARLTGAGWGGAVVLLAPEAEARRVVRAVGADFRAAFGRAPEAWSSRAAAGARAERRR